MYILKKLGLILLTLAICAGVFYIGAELDKMGWMINHNGTNVDDDTAGMLSALGLIMCFVSLSISLIVTTNAGVRALRRIRRWARSIPETQTD